MKLLKLTALMLLSSVSVFAMAQTGYTQYGNQRQYNNGVTASQYGNTTQFSNGVTANQYMHPVRQYSPMQLIGIACLIEE